MVNHQSLTLFFIDLKNLLINTAGMAVVRTVGATDFVLDAGNGIFLRIRKVVSGEDGAVDILLGKDPDVLSVEEHDPELCLPFSVVGGLVVADFRWDSMRRLIDVYVRSLSAGRISYRVQVDLGEGWISVWHQDLNDPSHDPNFKLNGGTFIQIGN